MAIGTTAAILGGAALAAGGSMLAANKSASAAKSAASTSASAQDRAAQMQWDMFNQTRADFDPYRQLGYGSLGALSAYSGVPLTAPDKADFYTDEFDAERWMKNMSAGERNAIGNDDARRVWGGSGSVEDHYDYIKRQYGDNYIKKKFGEQWVEKPYVLNQQGYDDALSQYEKAQAARQAMGDPFADQQGILDKIAAFDPNAGFGAAGKTLEQIKNLKPYRFYSDSKQALKELEGLEDNFSLEDSPVYAAQRDEVSRQIANKMSASGGINSSRFEDAMTRNLAPLVTGEYNRQYGRLSDLYGLKTQAADSAFKRNYGPLLDLYGLQTQAAQSRFGRSYGQLADLYNLYSGISNQKYGRLAGLAGMGQAAAGQTAAYGTSAANAAGQYTAGAGQAIAAGQNAAGQTQANMYSQLGALPLQMYSNYQLMNYLNPSTPGVSSAANGWTIHK